MVTAAGDHEEAMRLFEDNLIGQLERNGFPEKAVGFSLETIYEAASRKGFSFNRIRERLEAKGLSIEIQETRVVFRQKNEAFSFVPQETDGVSQGTSPDTPGTAGFEEIAADLLTKISPAQMQQFREMVGQLSPQDMAAMQQEFESMGENEKRDLMLKMKGLFGGK